MGALEITYSRHNLLSTQREYHGKLKTKCRARQAVQPTPRMPRIAAQGRCFGRHRRADGRSGQLRTRPARKAASPAAVGECASGEAGLCWRAAAAGDTADATRAAGEHSELGGGLLDDDGARWAPPMHLDPCTCCRPPPTPAAAAAPAAARAAGPARRRRIIFFTLPAEFAIDRDERLRSARDEDMRPSLLTPLAPRSAVASHACYM